MTDPDAPVVFCHGLLGWGDHELGGYPYFVCAERLKKKMGDRLPRFIYPSTGPVSSLHDQACELFYQLKGARVNYGRAHSERFAHAQYSRDYSGKALYPEWDESHPLDFVAHSMGAPVVRMLQYLLESGFFSAEDGRDWKTSARWVRSVTTVSGVHNGSTLTWILGADETTGLLKKNARLVDFFAGLLDLYARAERKDPKLAEWYDLHLDQWGIDSVDAMLDTPSFIESEDWALYDLTPNAMEKWNGLLVEYPDTWYFSYVTRSTFSLFGALELPLPIFTHWFLVPFSFLQCRYRAKSARWKGIIDSRWHANDGMCPSVSQAGPRLGRASGATRRRSDGKRRGQRRPGSWILMKKFGTVDHAEIAMLPHFWRIGRGIRMYRNLIRNIFRARKPS